MSPLSPLSILFLAAGYIAVGVVFVLLFRLYVRITQTRRTTPPLVGMTPAEMAILFQTMRGVIQEQKALAREFNESVDKKIRLIRQVLAKVVEEHRKICTAQEDLAGKLDAIKGDVDRMHGQVARVKDNVREDGPSASFEPVSAPELVEPDLVPLRAVASPEEPAASDDGLEAWAGLDFVDETPSDTVEVPELPPESSRDPELVRQAFRALLNPQPEPPASETAVPSASVSADDGNGRTRPSSIRSRVYEYHDAGMSAAQIAQELGIGKGEVRLMLSLRVKRASGDQSQL